MLESAYEPLGSEEHNAAVTSLFGPDVAIKPAFANADIIVSLDCDFVGSELTLQGREPLHNYGRNGGP